ncbi:MAG: glutamine--tRNA ligase/YqeY domain fusion protein [Bacteroidota bacterium]
MSEEIEKSLNFIEEIVESDLTEGKNEGRVLTRFPPEPNGYLHIGHAKSICLNFGLGDHYKGHTNLRFDDTNPVTEETEYVDSIKEDVKWLGFQWINELYASDYFEQLYGFACDLIKKGHAYVDDSSAEEMAQQKGTTTQPGSDSKYRNRSVAENLDLFERMKNGEFADGAKTLRAKIDMGHTNMHMRDPLMYRIKHAPHHRTGDKWCIYPMYDFAHGQSDSIEGITHSICTLEFASHRELYNWYIEKLGIFPSKQYEFARLNLSYTITSKRKLLQLVNEKKVDGWDDPRMPTISGMRRRGFTAESIRNFCDRIGVAKRDNIIDAGLLEFCVREDLNIKALRAMAVINPVKLIITNYEENKEELMLIDNTPDENSTKREVPFSNTLWIEKEDFMEEPMKKFFRLGPGLSVRLKGAYIVTCDSFKKDEKGNISEIYCSYIPNSKSGEDTSGLHVKGTIHWVSAKHGLIAEVRNYDRLFSVEDPAFYGDDFMKTINPKSLEVIHNVIVEPSLANAEIGKAYQFIRKGYYCLDEDSTDKKLIFNRTIGLKDTFAKEVK